MNKDKMELEEAIQILKKEIEPKENRIAMELDIQAIEIVLQALKNQDKECSFIREKNYDDIVYECNNCDEEWFFEYGNPKDNQYNYCPKCGAKIKEVIELEDEED